MTNPLSPPRLRALPAAAIAGVSRVFEFLPLTDNIRPLVLSHATAHDIHRAGVEEGMCSMYDDGLAKAIAGVTSVEEVLRVTRDI